MLLRPWDSPGKNTGVGCHFLLQLEPSVNTTVSYQALSTSFLCKFSQQLFFFCQDSKAGISLVVWWLRLHRPVQRVWGRIPGWGAKIPHASRSKKPKQNTFNEDFKKYGPHAKKKVKKRIARRKRQWGRPCRICPERPAQF